MALVIKFRKDRTGSTDPRDPDWADDMLCAHHDARETIEAMHREIEGIWNQSGPRRKRKKKRRQAWKSHSTFSDYFGTGALTNKQIRAVRRRITRMKKKLKRGPRYVIVQHQTGNRSFRCRGSRRAYVVGQGQGIMICPEFFKQTRKERASIVIHELGHKMGIFGTVHPEETDVPSKLKAFAKEHPRKARRNPDTYQQLARLYHAKSTKCAAGVA